MKSAEILKKAKPDLSDSEITATGIVNTFDALTRNITREKVGAKSKFLSPDLDGLFYQNHLPEAICCPKNLITALLLENIHPKAVELFRKEGYQVEIHPGAMEETELCERIRDVSILGVRSKTQVTKKVLAHANKLMAIGAFCIGTNQIDLKTCAQAGIPVFNAPYSNTRSVVEMAIGQIIILSRNIFAKSEKMHQGIWDKSAAGSFEVRGKKLGIVGYGNIGSQLSILAEILGMEVYYYDVVERLQLGNTKKCNSLKDLLELADFVSLHVDGRAFNQNLIGPAEFQVMKEGVVFLNLSRGQVVDIPSLVQNIQSGKIKGAAIDVFPYEPVNNAKEFLSELRGLPNVILTPHIGGSTSEAQENIANFVPNRMIEYMNSGNTYQSVNFPPLQLPELKDAHRLIHIHENVPGVLANIDKILARNHINILGQYLKTNEHLGYVITDINKTYDQEVLNELNSIANSIKFRMV